MKVHLIAVGGAVMHNMAIALKMKGFVVTGSDDKIFDPSKSRLEKHGILPDKMGWDENRITKDIDAIILGMHAREDNPELLKAKQLGLKIYSFPEYMFEMSRDKKRVVIGGSHGKTSITSMILHVLNELSIENDYLVGAQLEGFDCMVKTSDAPIAIFEGDEYLSSPIDRRPKFHLYKPHLAVLSGIAWDHINVFPTFEMYVDQFRIFISQVEKGGKLFYCTEDPELVELAKENFETELIPYSTHPHRIENGITYLVHDNREYEIQIFGKHNLQNLSAALHVCEELGVSKANFYKAIQRFKGAAKRLELVKRNGRRAVYRDFAHSPSKLKATSAAVKAQFSDRPTIACMELHTFSSLNQDFLGEYYGSMNTVDKAFVYFNPEVIKHKKLDGFTKDTVLKAFGNKVEVFTDKDEMLSKVFAHNGKGVLLMMSSGTFNGIDFSRLAEDWINC
jgi:UDP-N-acetylmuramate: L-alanyl-gamma-D-glutamyl-meso-diaminopimelate ligase